MMPVASIPFLYETEDRRPMTEARDFQIFTMNSKFII